jgi:hypothetical protein
MPRKKQSPLSEELSESIWGAGLDYKIDSDGGIRHASKELVPSDWYRLDIPEVHESLLREYIEISDKESVLNFLSLRGLPFLPEVTSPPSFTLDRLLGSAEFIYWLATIADAVKERSPIIEKKWLTVKKVDTHWYEVDLNPRPPDQSWKQNIYIARIEPEPETYLHDEGYAMHLCGKFCMASDLAEPLRFSVSQWDRLGKYASLFAAQRYLRRALEALLKDVPLAYQWVNDPSLTSPIIELKLAVNCPWQAICYALLKRMMGYSAFYRCQAPGCGKLFARKRSHNKTCTPACYMRLRRSK